MAIHDRIRAGEFDNKMSFDQVTLDTYYTESTRLRELFHQALAKEYDMVGHPKELRLFNLALEAGNYSFIKVAYYYENLLELAR